MNPHPTLLVRLRRRVPLFRPPSSSSPLFFPFVLSCSLFNNIIQPSQMPLGSDMHLFRSGIAPKVRRVVGGWISVKAGYLAIMRTLSQATHSHTYA